MPKNKFFFRILPALVVVVSLVFLTPAAEARSKTKRKAPSGKPYLTAKSYAVVDMSDGRILHSRLPHLKLPPASTTKVMTALLVLEYLPLEMPVTVSKRAANVSPSKAGLKAGVQYSVRDLLTATVVSSSNDAAVALAETVAGSESEFAMLMNKKARELGMNETKFVNATGLPEKKQKQYTTAYDLTRLMRASIKDKRMDEMMAIVNTTIKGSDGGVLPLKAHNKMLWKKPKWVKGKTGWTQASKHTFVGTNYEKNKSIAFAMLSSQKPWTDIERLASFGIVLERRR